MKVGLTYDLKSDWMARGLTAEQAAEFDSQETVDAIAGALRELGHDVDCVGNLFALMPRLLAGERWDIVWNFAEGLRGIGRESQVPCLLEAHDVPFVFSDPLVCALTLHKAMLKRVVRDLGLPTPRFAVVDDLSQLDGLQLEFPLFAKPLAEGTSKGVDRHSKITDLAALRRVTAQLLERFGQSVLVEEYLPGREVTVGVVGTGPKARAVAVLEVVLLPGADAEVYTQRNKDECESLVEYRLAEGPFARDAEALALDVWRGIGARDGGRVDLRVDRTGRLSVIEVNPLPGMHPTHSDLPIMATLAGVSFEELIGAIFASATERR
ncbi:MAG: D-alanine--D-alanine ligase [Planctomycetes bacterium]|nr:D-alanine--D-alanine ligase [Planctomycetota bacterium]